MTYYNVRISDGVELNVGVPSDYTPDAHPARILRFINGDLVVGSVVNWNEEQGIATMTFPMHLWVHSCEDHDEEEGYEFVPYLRNVVPFDIQSPHPVAFNLSLCASIVVPSEHIARNYYLMLRYHKAISNETLGLSSKKETIH